MSSRGVGITSGLVNQPVQKFVKGGEASNRVDKYNTILDELRSMDVVQERQPFNKFQNAAPAALDFFGGLMSGTSMQGGLSGGLEIAGESLESSSPLFAQALKNKQEYDATDPEAAIKNLALGEAFKKDDKYKILEGLGITSGEEEIAEEIADKKNKGLFGNMSILELAKLYGLGTAGLGLLIQLTDEKQDVGLPADTMPEGNILQGTLNPTAVFPGLQTRADGGIMDLQDGGESIGPGTGTSDSIPAMLSDGEFVMTAEAVRGAGGGDRREGAKKMYEAMDKLEARA